MGRAETRPCAREVFPAQEGPAIAIRWGNGLTALVEKAGESIDIKCVEHVFLPQPAFAGAANPIGQVVEPRKAVSIGVNADKNPQLMGRADVAPVDVQPSRMGVYFDADTVLGCGGKNGFVI